MCVFLTALVLLSCKLVSNRLSDRELAATNIAMSFTLIASAEQYNYDIFTTPVPRIKPKKKTARPQTPTSQALESVKTQSGEQNTGEIGRAHV